MKIFVLLDISTATLIGVYSTAVDAFTTQQSLVKCGLNHIEIFAQNLNSCVLDATPSIVQLHEIKTNCAADRSLS